MNTICSPGFGYCDVCRMQWNSNLTDFCVFPTYHKRGILLLFSAGASLLEHYQQDWECIHLQGEQAARQADR